MTFFRAPPSSAPTTSGLVYTRKVSDMKASWTNSARFRSGQAARHPVGRSRATSSAWQGPVRATTFSRPVTWETIWLIRSRVTSSMPLVTETRTASGARWGATAASTWRMGKEGVAITTIRQSDTQAGSAEIFSSWGSVTLGSLGFIRLARISAAFSSLLHQRVVSWPFLHRSIERAVPQAPAPMTAVFMAVSPS